MVITRSYIEYAIIFHKDGTKEKVYLESDRLEYGDIVYKKIEHARKKSRPIENKGELKESYVSWLNKWYELQVKLIMNSYTKDYYNVSRINKPKEIFKVHKDYVKILPKDYIWTLRH